MDFKQGGQAIQRIRKERGMTQEQLAELTDVASNSISRIERGLLMPALPTLIDICNALGTGADSILAAYIAKDTPIRWTPLAEKLGRLDLETQHKIETVLDCLIETI
ncbi:MAG: helix-turn-helix domain-containing protein [Oscillospiraceae bacterium]|nr:helix-turn-helix domain-containing protein [Oscillospiraceae bacterium]